MRYWVTWSYRANDMIKGILCDEVEIQEPITSVEVVERAIRFHVGEPFAHEVERALSWSPIENLPKIQNSSEKDIRFFKRGEKWYADVKGHTMEENEMVSGADDVLEALAEGGSELTITVSTLPDPKSIMHFKIKDHDDYGAAYTDTATGSEIWICNVTHDVFGEHPDDLYVLEIK